MYFSVHAYASYSIKDNLRLYVHLFGLSYCSMWNMLISPDFEVRLRNQNAATTFEPMLGFFYQKLPIDGVVVSQKKNNVP